MSVFFQLIKKDFFRDVSTLMVGTLISQIITFLAMPILTRLYTPADFGIYSVFFSIASIIGIVSTGKLDAALILPKEEKKSEILFSTGNVLVMATVILTCILIIGIPKSLYVDLHVRELHSIIYLLPLAVLFIGMFQMLYSWHNKNRQYSHLSKNKIILSTSSNSLNLAGGITHLGQFGLATGLIAGYAIACWHMFRKMPSEIKNAFFKYNHRKDSSILREYKNFPKYLVPFAFLNSITVNILVFVFGYLYSPAVVGLYSQANKVVNYPLFLVSSSFTSVFYQRLSVSNNRKSLYVYSLFLNFLIGCLILIPFIFFGEQIFAFVFGNQWIESGRMVKYLIPMTAIGFAARNVSDVYSVTDSNHLLLIWQIISFVGSLILLVLLVKFSIYFILGCYSLWSSFMYIVLAFGGYRLLKNDL